MNRKTGILSDKMFEENCEEYTAIPLGYINSNYLGFLGNPFLTGIKPTKYIRSAPKPASADVMAVNTARFQGGNLAKNARKILDSYQVSVREWKPPAVGIMTPAIPGQPDMHGVFGVNNQAVNILPRRQTHANIGSQITADTMGRNVVTAEMGTDSADTERRNLNDLVFPNGMSLGTMTAALDYFRGSEKGQQVAIGRRLLNELDQFGLVLSPETRTATRSILMGRTGTADDRMKQAALMVSAMMHHQVPVDVEQLFSLPTARNLEASGSNDPPIPERQPTTDTDLSDARTAEPMPRQGIAMTPTVQETPETEYK